MTLFHIVKYALISLLGLRIGPDAPAADVAIVCSTREVYSACQGHCERTCYNREEPSSCATDVCVSACVCAEGYVRGPNGACVPETECAAPPSDLPAATACKQAACEKYCRDITGGRQGGGSNYRNIYIFTAPPSDLPAATACKQGACEKYCRDITGGRQGGRCYDGNCACSGAPPSDVLAATACKQGACEKYCREITGGRSYGVCYDGNCACYS
ncbi:hypothetical protein AVEN_215097-1 [Araneus ventricosus]|uniref:TIL domain-containing protein n=1 Tax=Araneus ventricosus TaxID=182803 RepID=A0A4Y2K8I7_ARAVE|nr:hypothetical protein AVEN_215097-1 [Araneus ventricosus]